MTIRGCKYSRSFKRWIEIPVSQVRKFPLQGFKQNRRCIVYESAMRIRLLGYGRIRMGDVIQLFIQGLNLFFKLSDDFVCI